MARQTTNASSMSAQDVMLSFPGVATIGFCHFLSICSAMIDR